MEWQDEIYLLSHVCAFHSGLEEGPNWMESEAGIFKLCVGTCHSYHPLIPPVFPENEPGDRHHSGSSASHTDAWMWSPESGV